MKNFKIWVVLLLVSFTGAIPLLHDQASVESIYKITSRNLGYETPQYDPETELENSLTPFNGYVRVCGLHAARVGPQKWVAVKVIEAINDHEVNRYIIERPMRPIDLVGACYKKGGLLAAEIQSRKNDINDTASREVLNKHYKEVFKESESHNALSLLGAHTDFEFTSIATKSIHIWPTEDQPAYSNLYDPRGGIILLKQNDARRDPNKDTKSAKSRITLPDLAWLQYKALAEKSRPELELNRLQHVIQQDIASSETKYIIQQATMNVIHNFPIDFAFTDPDEIEFFEGLTFTLDDPRTERWFLAILGTEEGSFAGRILADHGKAINKRKISRMITSPHNLIAEFE
jgi:hypothetical protein